MVTPFGLGAVKSPHDYRDVHYAHTGINLAAPLPASYFNDITKLPFDNQKKLGACIGHASEKYKQEKDFVDTSTVFDLSPRFIYAMCKEIDGIPGEGTAYRLAVKTLANFGCMTQKWVPNNTELSHSEYINLKALTLPEQAWNEAQRSKISGYAQVNVSNPNELQQAIFNEGGCMLAVEVGEEWWTAANGETSWAEKDVLPLRPPQTIISGHAIYLYGYDHVGTRLRFWFRNSWSTEWGAGGNGYFFYDEYKNFMSEAWTVVDIPDTIASQLKLLPTKENFKHSFSTNLAFKQRSDEVTALQTALMIDGEFDRSLYFKLLTEQSAGYYGQTTADALLAFQLKYAVDTPQALQALKGQSCGPKTRAKLNSLFG